MFQHNALCNLNDYFLDFNKRPHKCVYFYRINGYNMDIKVFVEKYYNFARNNGVIIEGKIPNPNEKNLAYYDEIMGRNFQFDIQFIDFSLKKWLPRMNDYQRKNISESIFYTLNNMKKIGKNDNIIKNAYIKFMCWLYYRFEKVITMLGDNKIPKILYEGNISDYELKIISILSNAGCDVVLLQYNGDENYIKIDPVSELSYAFQSSDMQSFPENFSIKQIRKDAENYLNNQRLYSATPKFLNCTNAWIEGNGLSDLNKNVSLRGNDKNLFYNCFIRINGVEDKTTYLNELYSLGSQIKISKRKILIIENEIPKPYLEEINSISRKNYKDKEQMIIDLSNNISYSANIELQKIIKKSFIDILLNESKSPEMNLNKLTNKAVYLLCWLKRYQSDLFFNWKINDISCFIYLGGCKNQNEALFLRFLARLPIDILILVPDLNFKCCLKDDLLYEINNPNSMIIQSFPIESSEIRVGTPAYHAERELDEIMYQDSNIYRNRQYNKAISITLQTMYEEIEILWNQETQYRPNFNIINSTVNIPVIFAKISGIKDSDISKYWSNVKRLVNEDVFVIKDAPFINSEQHNPIKPYVTEFLKTENL